MKSVLAAAILATFVSADSSSFSTGLAASYELYRTKHGKTQKMSTSLYKARMAQYAKTKARVDAHNSQEGVSWKAGLNKFADHFESEFESMLGYRRLGKWWLPSKHEKQFHFANRSSSFLQMKTRSMKSSVDWRTNLVSGKRAKEQGACGSCWAVAAVGALEMHAEKSQGQTPPELSFKNLVDCTPNPEHCGGDGGCKGATAELAFEYVQQAGLADASTYVGDNDATEQCQTGLVARASTDGYVKLPVNRLQPLMDALSNEGPVVVSVDGGPWGMYESGVFSGCKQDATINHAVLAVGYGTADSGEDYWLIRNSWGGDWGENGFIRLLRHSSDEGDEGFCGTDHDPKQGNGCDGGPPTIPVCGMCGVLTDSSYPTGVQIQ
eukprot:TRINITY_DN703_c0_g1_i1.p1 TRINITY_DN703_c0_g1~~TRINITY_DN703_c0_g1_i1.p1  ORF type:complete len:380 (+),score=78.01 TRINITY_DN703_c0_g1_i1:90-1229(+)